MRRHDWQSRFAAVIKEYQHATFVVGQHDCCLFVSDVIRAITDIDPAESFRGKYDSAIGGARLVREFCGGDMVALVESKFAELGFVEVAPVMAQRGDIGLTNTQEFGDALGVCLGSKFAFMGATEMLYPTHEMIDKAWRIW